MCKNVPMMHKGSLAGQLQTSIKDAQNMTQSCTVLGPNYIHVYVSLRAPLHMWQSHMKTTGFGAAGLNWHNFFDYIWGGLPMRRG